MPKPTRLSNKYKRIARVVATLLAVIPIAAPVSAEMGAATAISGDRLELSGRSYCLFGIDAPEPGQRCTLRSGKPYDCGRIATTALMDLILGATVQCKPTQDRAKGCTIAKCAAGGSDLSENMVHTGWALAQPETGAIYGAIQARAKERRHGLWAGTFVPPWVWRRQAGQQRDK